METILESLKGVNAYPVPLRTLVEIAERRGLSLTSEATQADLRGKDYKLATADLLLWLSLAPNISQGGQSYSFTDEQRQQFRNRANALFDEFGEETSSVQPTYGYKGSRL
jgi:hypothetical protein